MKMKGAMKTSVVKYEGTFQTFEGSFMNTHVNLTTMRGLRAHAS